MKVFAVVVLALAVFAHTESKDVAGDVEKVIKEILEKIPEPLIDAHDEKYSLNLIVEKLDITLTDAVLKGIKNLDIKQLDYAESTGRLDYDLTFGEVDFDLDFELDLSGLIEVEHHPTINLSLTDLKLAGYTVVDETATPNQLTDFKLVITLGGAKVDLKNILNDDELTETLNTLLNKDLPDAVDNIAALLEPVVSPIVQSIINIILRETEN